MTDAEREQIDKIMQTIWRIAGLHTLTEVQVTLVARIILQREARLRRVMETAQEYVEIECDILVRLDRGEGVSAADAGARNTAFHTVRAAIEQAKEEP